MQSLLRSLGKLALDSIESVTIALSVWLLLYLFVGHPTKVMGYSMQPNFEDQDCIYTEKISYKFSSPVRGDVVSIHAPEAAHCATGTGCDFFKRIIGLPGETVEVKDGSFVIDGQKLVEEYIPATIRTQPGPAVANSGIHLKDGEYFVAGDNRAHSLDSRTFGAVPKENIIGKALLRWCPRDQIGIISHPSYSIQ